MKPATLIGGIAVDASLLVRLSWCKAISNTSREGEATRAHVAGFTITIFRVTYHDSLLYQHLTVLAHALEDFVRSCSSGIAS